MRSEYTQIAIITEREGLYIAIFYLPVLLGVCNARTQSGGDDDDDDENDDDDDDGDEASKAPRATPAA